MQKRNERHSGFSYIAPSYRADYGCLALCLTSPCADHHLTSSFDSDGVLARSKDDENQQVYRILPSNVQVSTARMTGDAPVAFRAPLMLLAE